MSASFQVVQSDVELTDVPNNAIIVHSTNCFGNWGAGFALALHDHLPTADRVYVKHCNDSRSTPEEWPEKGDLVGKCVLIPPQEDDETAGNNNWVACLFTSYGYGRATKKKAGKDVKAKIVEQTKAALKDLYTQLTELEKKNGGADSELATPKLEIYSPKINSGSFGVKWEETQSMIETTFTDWKGKWYLLAPHHP